MNPAVYAELALEKDPFKQGINYVCMAHTSLNTYKSALSRIRSYERGLTDCDILDELRRMEDSYKCLLQLGYCLCKTFGRVYTLEVVR